MKRGYTTGTAVHEIRILPGVIQVCDAQGTDRDGMTGRQQAIRKKQTSRYSCAEERLANGDLGNGSNMPMTTPPPLNATWALGGQPVPVIFDLAPTVAPGFGMARDSVLNTANYGPMALVFASPHWHHMRSPSQANNGGTKSCEKTAPNSSEAYIYLWMPFLLDFLFLSIFTLSPAPGNWFIVPNSDRVTRDIPSCILVCCFLRQSFLFHIPFLGHFLATDEIGFRPLGFWKHNRRQSLFLVQPTDIPPANRSVRLCASAILPSKLQETFEVLAEKPIQEPRAGFAGNQVVNGNKC
ncbi:hypothetical protein HCBG_01173 [Histoplasma capsulatum G186AR]|uniref:Uncharacterized protein n=1 Tax=Ajellomyces capsulatus (strain G186AR / H82 / ATCC MYA-2454 / RMSCC 2432) TaxID=447093 RepID=C0NDH7_AJECG|nr:uncharacterized protein HCBG_01173 [Histoplasma capsulatum G186AR]EEH11718.1 hypothetical protein HCBG_01173 [Histoplasma capsulatum G186AR]